MKAALLALLVVTACFSATTGAAFTRSAGHVIFVSDRDGDNDVYGISSDGSRAESSPTGALTRVPSACGTRRKRSTRPWSAGASIEKKRAR